MMDKFILWRIKTKNCVSSIFYDEKGEVNILAMIILLAIALILAVAFRKKIMDLVKGLFDEIDSSEGGMDYNPLST